MRVELSKFTVVIYSRVELIQFLSSFSVATWQECEAPSKISTLVGFIGSWDASRKQCRGQHFSTASSLLRAACAATVALHCTTIKLWIGAGRNTGHLTMVPTRRFLGMAVASLKRRVSSLCKQRPEESANEHKDGTLVGSIAFNL